MTDQTKSHYAVEDIPPDDIDTQVKLFEEAASTVKDGAEVAKQLREDAEKVLGGIFHAADKAGDTALAERVNDVWEQVQSLATVATRQGAALRGANGAIGALKEQRDKVLQELNGLKEAIDNLDTNHEALSDFVEELEQGWYEWQQYSGAYDQEYDQAYDDAHDNIRSDIFRILKDRIGMTYTEADVFYTLISGEEILTQKQIDILKQFAVTLRAEKAEADE